MEVVVAELTARLEAVGMLCTPHPRRSLAAIPCCLQALQTDVDVDPRLDNEDARVDNEGGNTAAFQQPTHRHIRYRRGFIESYIPGQRLRFSL